jgi:prephenate dehydratase
MHKIASTARVAFQGEPGAFSQIAARKLLGDSVETVACPTFESLFDSIGQGRADLILAPLENTLAGPVLRCYDLLYQSALAMIGEVVLRIGHCVIGCPGSSLQSIRRIQSHPVALAQCENFFADHPAIAKAVADDTAGSVRQVMQAQDPTVAAIASDFAAQLYGAQVLVANVEDDPLNFTRFALLQPTAHAVPNDVTNGVTNDATDGLANGFSSDATGDLPADAALDDQADASTIVLTVANEAGALFRCLEPLALNSVDLMSLTSRPLVGAPWHYRFFLEVAAAASDPRMAKALAELELRTVELRVLGSYRSGK